MDYRKVREMWVTGQVVFKEADASLQNAAPADKPKFASQLQQIRANLEAKFDADCASLNPDRQTTS